MLEFENDGDCCCIEVMAFWVWAFALLSSFGICMVLVAVLVRVVWREKGTA